MKKDKNEVTIDRADFGSKLPLTIELDRTFDYTLQGPGELPIISRYLTLKGCDGKRVSITGKITIQNQSVLKYEDVFLIFKVSAFDKEGNATSTSVQSKKYFTTGQNEIQANWDIIDGQDIQKGGRLLIELLCNRVYQFNDNGRNPRWGGLFKIVRNSHILISKSTKRK